jgi:high-affinity nickel-transport protein
VNALADWIKDGATWPQSGQRSWKKRWCKSPSAFFKKALKESFKNPFLIMPTNALNLALFSAAVLGFRHGFDYDHIAAISDITSVETDRKRAMRMGLVYVLGHAFMVAVLGGVVIFFQRSLPKSIDNWAERAVGLTLVVLGLYVLGTLLRDKTNLPKSRASLLIAGFSWLGWRIPQLFGAAASERPAPLSGSYSRRSVFLIGIIHGLGAETPSQLLLFLLAANLGGLQHGLLGLAVFLAGLLIMNTLMTASAVGIFGLSAAKPAILRFVIGATAAYSVVVGTIFLFGVSSVLPQLGG